MAADQKESDRRARDPESDRSHQASQVFAGDQQFPAQRRQVVIVERLFQHLTAEKVGEDSYAAEEDAEPQVVEMEQAGKDQTVFADAVASAAPAQFEQPMH